MAEMPETRFTRVDDLDIAYQVVGPPAQLDLVFVPGWVSHLEVMWELPEFAHFLDRLAGMERLIMFDKRGTGLAVHVGARVAGLAHASEVLVTSTVQMLVLGSGIGFADRGRHRLKGRP